MTNTSIAIKGYAAIKESWDSRYPKEPMDGDDTEEICKLILGMLDEYYANV